MTNPSSNGSAGSGSAANANPLAVLDRIRKPVAPSAPGERCDLCGEPVPDEHGHLVDLVDRGLRCACRGCYLLFTADGAGGKRFRSVPDSYRAVTDFELGPGDWDALQIPVGVAFFFHNSEAGKVVAFYPSPAGATESLLPLGSWDAIAERNAALASMLPDVEALLVRSERDQTREGYVVPIDACYELVGLLRAHWRGFDGGQEVRQAMTDFFAGVRARSGL